MNGHKTEKINEYRKWQFKGREEEGNKYESEGFHNDKY
jgi:hypothetical protein